MSFFNIKDPEERDAVIEDYRHSSNLLRTEK